MKPRKSPPTIEKSLACKQHTFIGELQRLMFDFVDERDWWKYHSPKNLAISISLEASELLEHFQWTQPDETLTPKQQNEVEEEMSDVLAYLLSMANVLNIDFAEAFRKKMEKNKLKYPVEKCRGTWKKAKKPKPVMK